MLTLGAALTVMVALQESLTSGFATVAVLVMSPGGVLARTVAAKVMVTDAPGANCPKVALITHRLLTGKNTGLAVAPVG